MNKQCLCTLTQRLNRLERENRWWKVLGIVSAAVLGLVVLTGATGSKVADEVRARKFTVVDNKGRTRGMLGMKAREGLEPGVLLELVDSDQKLRVQLRGSGGLGFYDSKERMRIELSLIEFGASSEDIDYIEKGGLHVPSHFRPEENVWTRLAFRDAHSKPLVFLEVDNDRTDGNPRLTLVDKNGAKAVLGHTKLKNFQTGVVERRPASSLVLFNKDRKVIWSAP